MLMLQIMLALIIEKSDGSEVAEGGSQHGTDLGIRLTNLRT